MRKWRRPRCTAPHEARIGTDPPGRKDGPRDGRCVCRCTVNGAKVECDRVSRFHVPAADYELIPPGVNVRYVLELLVRIERAAVETRRPVAGRIPPMRPGDTFQADIARDRV